MQLDGSLRKGFRLGDWEIRPIEGLVSSAQGARHLQPKTMDVLVCLAASDGQVVTRDELIRRVWGDNAVSDEPLTRCIHEIRRSLDDHREQPTYIQTIPKRGYRLLVDTEELPPETLAAPDAPGEGLFWQVTRQRVLWVGAIYASCAWLFVALARYAEARATAELVPPAWLLPALVVVLLLGFPVAIFFAWVRQLKFDASGSGHRFPGVVPLLWSRRGIDFVLVTLVISVLAGVAFDLRPGNSVRSIGFADYRLAVLPFSTTNEAGEENWLGEGFADDLRRRLDAYDSLAISSGTSSARHSLAALDPQQIGRELDVQYLLQGWVIRTPAESGAASDGSIRIKAQLIDAVTGFKVWADSYKRPIAELFAVQQEIKQQVAMALQLEGSPQAELVDDDMTVMSMAAYDHYLRGRNHLHKATSVQLALTAADHFSAALAIDPRMTMARTSLCRAYTRAFELGGSDESYNQANSACAEALLQNPEAPAARLALANFFRVTGYPRQAAEEFLEVANQHPANTDAWFGLAQSYTDTGLSAEADRAFRTVLDYQPDYAAAKEAYVDFLLAEGRYLDAVEVARSLIHLDRERIQAYEYLATALFMTGSFEASIQASRQVISRDSQRLEAALNIAQNYYHLERYQRAIDIYQQAAQLLPEDYSVPGLLAVAYAQLEDDEAAEYSQQAFVQARQLAEQWLQHSPRDAAAVASLAYYCAALGDRLCSQGYLAQAFVIEPESIQVNYLAALVHMESGDARAASDAMERAIQLGYPQILILSEPLLAQVRSDRRFATTSLIGNFRRDYR